MSCLADCLLLMRAGVLMINVSQLKSGNDMAGVVCAIYDQEKGGFFDRKPENQPILAKNAEKKQLRSKKCLIF